jgi:hypothetical protein
MNPSDVHEEPGRNGALVVSLVLAIAFTAAFWDRLSVSFSRGEASFVHQALRASGQATSPDFCPDANQVPARILAVVQQLVGFNERSLRLAMLVLFFASTWFLSEIVPGRGRLRFVMPFVMVLAGASSSVVVEPGRLAVLPAALALLASPIGPPITNFRALLGLAGSLALGSIGFEAAFVPAVAIAAMCLVRGSMLERLTGLATAAAGPALAWILHGASRLHFPSMSFSGSWSAATAPLVLIAIIVTSLFIRDGFRRHRLALAFGWFTGLLALASIAGPMEVLPLDIPCEQRNFGAMLAFSALFPPLWVLLASALTSSRAMGVIAVVLFAVVILSNVLDSEARKDSPALEVLDQARMVAQPGAALAVSGNDRIAVAVYARFGRAPMMPIAYVPEGVTRDDLAKWCRDRGIRQLWVSPPLEEAPPGFSAPASRPASVPLLMPLVVEGS